MFTTISPKDQYDEAMLVGMMMSDITNGIQLFNYVEMRRTQGAISDAERDLIGLLADTYVLKMAQFDFSKYKKPDLYYQMAAGLEYRTSVRRYYEARKAMGITSFSDEMETKVQLSFKKFDVT